MNTDQFSIPSPCYVFADGGRLVAVNVGRDKRREWDSKSFQQKFPENADWRLTQAARARVVENLTKYGNVIDEAQHAALLCVVACFTMLAAGVKTGRYAYDLPPGYGKTEAVVAWCAEAYRYEPKRTALICSTKVVDLCKIKTKLIAQGVPAEEIGIVHSYDVHEEEGVTWPATDDNAKRQFLLATHERIKQGDDKAKRYKLADGKRRDLIVWDESLLISEQRSVDYTETASAVGGLLPFAKTTDKEDTQAALAWLAEAWETLEKEWTEQKITGRAAEIINLKPLPDDPKSVLRALPKRVGKELLVKEPVKFLIAVASEPLRVYYGEQGGFIKYDVVVPEEYTSIAVLDASFAMRALERVGGKIKTDPHYEAISKRYGGKRYDHVTLYRMEHSSGRTTINTDLSYAPEHRRLVREYVDLVRTIPVTEGVLTTTHKYRPEKRNEPNIAEELKEALRDAGVDINATIEVQARKPDGTIGTELKPRFGWLTYGRETSSNDYTHLSHGIAFGTYYRRRADLAAAATGQADNLTLKLDKATMADLEKGETLHSQFQAMNRLSMRETVNGQARPSSWYFIYPDDGLDAELATAMPGVVFKTWETTAVEKRGPTKTETTTTAIVEYWSGLPQGPAKVSNRAIKTAVCYDGGNKGWNDALWNARLERPEWRSEGSSHVRD